MKRLWRVLALVVALSGVAAPAAQTANSKPKLVVAIIVDQFRYDYLTRFRSEFRGGFDMLLTKGAHFTAARYLQVPTVTAVGHSIFLSGAMPSASGIVGNSWFERDEKKIVTSVCDDGVTVVGGQNERTPGRCADSDPASPHRLLVSTVGDELRNADDRAKVIGVSIKARGAIMPSGHRANAAYWFDDATGHFVTSTFYVNDLPAWAGAFNRRELAAGFTRKAWPGFPAWSFIPEPGSARQYEKLAASPWGNELIEQFAEAAIEGEQLGQHAATDLLTVSFSSNDYVGHMVGPDAPEVKDMTLRTDRLLAGLFETIERRVGLANTLVVLSADHGVAPLPEIDEQRKMPGGYVVADVEDAVNSALNRALAPANWLVPGAGETTLYFDQEALANAKRTNGSAVPASEVYRIAREALLSIPQLHVARVYTRDQLAAGVSGDEIAAAVNYGFYPRRSGDLFVVFEPNYLPGTKGTSHFSPWSYDQHVPLLFMGPGIRAGVYPGPVSINDVAPTLAYLLAIETPSGSSGRVLQEMLDNRGPA